MLFRILVALAIVGTCFIGYSAYSTSTKYAKDQHGNRYPIDEKGCWASPLHVIKYWGKWSNNNKKFTSYYQNMSDSRVYISYCNEMKVGYHSCAATGLGPGKKTSKTSYDSDDDEPTGEFAYAVSGSIKLAHDWTCNDDAPDPRTAFDD